MFWYLSQGQETILIISKNNNTFEHLEYHIKLGLMQIIEQPTIFQMINQQKITVYYSDQYGGH